MLQSLVLHEIHLGQTHELGLTVDDFILCLDRAADDLLWRDIVDAFGPWALNSTPQPETM